MNIKSFIENIAFEMGFDAVGITTSDEIVDSNKHFLEWREKGFAADMAYLLRENPINSKPAKILPGAKSIISLLVNYYTPLPEKPGNDYGRIAAYAVGIDYHIVLKEKIKLFQEKIQKEIGSSFISKGFSDSVPLLEKSFARNSGNGFQGKHTLLINKPLGSYFFICELISNLNIEITEEVSGTCGKCTRCIDVCPTKAIVSPYELDSRLCISYQTIENKKSIPLELRNQFGDWLFGCDLCQDVCPYNKSVKETNWKEFKPESGLGHWIKLKDILRLKSDEEFKVKFFKTPLLRPKRIGLIRNAAIVAGNNRSEESLPELFDLAENEPNQIIREHVLWALSKFEDKKARNIIEKYMTSNVSF